VPTTPLRVLCVHGVNTPETDTIWQDGWKQAIELGVARWNPGRKVELVFARYNDLFRGTPLGPLDYVRALARLLGSGISTLAGSLIPRERTFGQEKTFGGVTQAVRWTAGMVAQWVDSERLRDQARGRLGNLIRAHDPEIILAHSLGSLLCYDAILNGQPSLVRGRTFISFGSQIGNPFVRNTFGGRLVGLNTRFWYHLFNRHDLETFTWPIRLQEGNFLQVEADFDLAGIIDHDAACYLTHAGMVETVWPQVLGVGPRSRSMGGPAPRSRRASAAAQKSGTRRRALLVGINEYPAEADRLEGCVNDVFLMSSVLQECGFDASDIRVVLDRRATAKGILDRLDWLLEDARPGDERVFFYSGHGAQIPAYDESECVDRKDECLVPYDFDWSIEHSVTDNQFFDLYSQLPYETRFVTVLDCCYSGGMTREGGPRIRGLTPPDDIRHRDLRWDQERRMWTERNLPKVNRSLSRQRDSRMFVGKDGDEYRIGRAALLRRLPNAQFDQAKKDLGHKGPYMPLILEACGESQTASEYRHGVISYGAFTYCLANVLRTQRDLGTNPSFKGLVRTVKRYLRELKYEQVPVLVGPRESRNATVPWRPARPSKSQSRRTRSGRAARR